VAPLVEASTGAAILQDTKAGSFGAAGGRDCGARSITSSDGRGGRRGLVRLHATAAVEVGEDTVERRGEDVDLLV
jgi:hypothetical protein